MTKTILKGTKYMNLRSVIVECVNIYQLLAKSKYKIDYFNFFLILNPRHKVLNTAVLIYSSC